jgi:hypothetical protein
LPLTDELVEAGTDPNDFTPSDLIGGTEAGEEDIGAATSSIEPKVTEEPMKTSMLVTKRREKRLEARLRPIHIFHVWTWLSGPCGAFV